MYEDQLITGQKIWQEIERSIANLQEGAVLRWRSWNKRYYVAEKISDDTWRWGCQQEEGWTTTLKASLPFKEGPGGIQLGHFCVRGIVWIAIDSKNERLD